MSNQTMQARLRAVPFSLSPSCVKEQSKHNDPNENAFGFIRWLVASRLYVAHGSARARWKTRGWPHSRPQSLRSFWPAAGIDNKGNNRILPIRFHVVCIYSACLKWLLPKLSIRAAGQKDRRFWGREWDFLYLICAGVQEYFKLQISKTACKTLRITKIQNCQLLQIKLMYKRKFQK